MFGIFYIGSGGGSGGGRGGGRVVNHKWSIVFFHEILRNGMLKFELIFVEHYKTYKVLVWMGKQNMFRKFKYVLNLFMLSMVLL